MTVTPTYPGVYIEELPSLVHTITPAPTSIAVFVGYTHPFLTKTFATNPTGPTPAAQLFSFADYQRIFGGFFSSPWLPDYVGQAVYQFFLNGGPTCYVVGLPAQEYLSGGEPIPSGQGSGQVVAASVDVPFGADNVTFKALQPVGIPAVAATSSPAVGTWMQVTFSNVKNSTADAPSPTPSDPGDMADIVVTYGTTVETYRRVQLANLVTALQNSSLVQVTLPTSQLVTYPGGGSYPLAYASPPAEDWTIINKTDFAPVFAENASLDKVPIFNLLATPGITDIAVTSEAVAYCERKRAFYIMDTPSPSVLTPPLTTPLTTPEPPLPNPPWDVNDLIGDTAILSEDFPVSTNAALYYPWLVTTDPVTGAPSTAPPSGFVAGMYGQEDNARGVWKSPAGIETALLGTTGVDPHGHMNDNQQGALNQNALDCIRQFPGIGTVIFGARTTAGADVNTAQQQWRYVAVRRMALFIEQTLYTNLTWAVFEGNATPLWNALTQEVTAFMLTLFRQNAFAGDTPSQAFLVKCDSTTTTPTDVANGIVNILVGFAPLVPAEFVVVQIAQLAGQAQS